jgi:uncharacterized protein YbjT (DUF2867 family)
MYAIVGATGFTGSVVATQLLFLGKKVRAVSRSKERLASLIAKGAEPYVLESILDEPAMAQAFRGVEAVYAMVPPVSTEIPYDKAASVMAKAAVKSGVSHVVSLSGVGAHLQGGGGHCADSYYFEEAFNKVGGLNILHLRCCFFMTSFFSWIDQIKTKGNVRGLLRGDVALPRIAARDIGQVATDALASCNFQGIVTRELQGQRDISMDEAAKIIGNTIGMDLSYVQVSPQEWIDAQVSQGRSAVSAEQMNEMYCGWNDGSIRCSERRSAANTTPTTFETFVTEEFVPRFLAK